MQYREFMKNIQIGLMLFVLLTSAIAFAADWQYYGSGNNFSSFFDAKSVQHPDKDAVRVWVKDISQKTLMKYYSRNQVIHDTGTKLATGYSPAIFQIESFKRAYHSNSEMQDGIIDTIMAEVTANGSEVHSNSLALLEIDCKGKQFAMLSLITYKKDGSIDETEEHQQPLYTHYPPDSAGEWLSLLVCPKN
jgi:hypothetical protein